VVVAEALPSPAPASLPEVAATQLAADVPDLVRLLPHADRYLQDEVQVALHPTLTRVWCRKGRRS
jgi:hypothetical protein